MSKGLYSSRRPLVPDVASHLVVKRGRRPYCFVSIGDAAEALLVGVTTRPAAGGNAPAKDVGDPTDVDAFDPRLHTRPDKGDHRGEV